MTVGLAVSRHPDAVVIETTHPRSGPMKGGAFDARGEIIPSSLLARHHGLFVSAGNFSPPIKCLAGEYIFGGYLIDQYGHFLLESCHRLWFAKMNPNMPVVWLFGKPFPPYQRRVLDLLGITNAHVIIDAPTSIECLVVPEPAYRIQDFCHPTMVEFMGQYQAEWHGKKVWLSRGGLSPDLAHVDGEQKVEAALIDKGWDIFHPQKHSTQEQLAVIGGAAHVAGFAGSALHSLILVKNFRGRVTVFTRGPTISKNFETIAIAKNIAQNIVHVSAVEGESRGHRTSITLADANSVINAL